MRERERERTGEDTGEALTKQSPRSVGIVLCGLHTGLLIGLCSRSEPWPRELSARHGAEVLQHRRSKAQVATLITIMCLKDCVCPSS